METDFSALILGINVEMVNKHNLENNSGMAEYFWVVLLAVKFSKCEVILSEFNFSLVTLQKTLSAFIFTWPTYFKVGHVKINVENYTLTVVDLVKKNF